MSLKSWSSFSAGAIMLLAAAPAWAASSWPTVDLLSSGAADTCAAASAAAQESGRAIDSDLSNCSRAVKLALHNGSRAEALNNRSVLYYARANYDAALKLNDRMAEGIVNRGSIFLMQHRPQAAAVNFSRALDFNPAHPEKVYFNRALAREDMGDMSGAYADFAQASRLAPQWDQPRREMGRFTIRREKPVS